MRTILDSYSSSLIIDKSRFISVTFHVQNAFEVEAFLKAVRKQYPKLSTIAMPMSSGRKKRALMTASLQRRPVVPFSNCSSAADMMKLNRRHSLFRRHALRCLAVVRTYNKLPTRLKFGGEVSNRQAFCLSTWHFLWRLWALA
jgi:uncharacterized protein (DUF488 family)